MALRKDQIERLIAINAECRFRHVGALHEENENTGKARMIKPGYVICDIFDATVQVRGDKPERSAVPYAIGQGPDEPTAFDAAIVIAENSPKPMTAAQTRDKEAGRLRDEATSKMASELEAAKARIKELEEAQPRRGRRPRIQEEETQEPAQV